MKVMKLQMLFLAMISIAAFAAPCANADDTPRDGVFIHISHGAEKPHRLLMALNMAALMAEDHDVLVYFDIKAVDVLLKDAADVSFSHFPSSKAQIKVLLEKKATLMACPGCLKARGKTKDDLAEGVQIANKRKFFSFTKGRIITLDY